MKYFIFLFVSMFVFANTAFSSEKEFNFRRNTLYTITYLIGENKTKTLEDVYYKDLWTSDPVEKVPFIALTGEITLQPKYLTYVEVLKIYAEGKKESYIIPVKNIVEIKIVITKGFKAGSDSESESEGDSKLKMSIK